MGYKYSIILSLLSFVISAHGKEKFDCNILKMAITSKDFARQFYVPDTFINRNIVFVDTNRYFQTCQIIVHDKPAEFFYELNYSPNRGAGVDSKGKIVILGVTKRKGVYRMRFWAPYSNATLGLKIVKGKRGYKVITESRGSF